MTRVDMHVKILDERMVSRTRARGIGVLVHAPHLVHLPGAHVRAGRFSDDDLLIIPAREVFTGSRRNRKHVLVVRLSDLVLDFITLGGAFAESNQQGAATLVPHPTFLTMSLTAEDVAARRDDIDAAEMYNTKALPRNNRRGRDITRKTGLPGFTSSYAHLRGTVGEAWTEFDRDIDSEADLVTALREGAERRVVRHTGISHGFRGAVGFVHLGYKNSWGEIGQLLLPGMKPTHLDHAAYGGRFDGVSIY